MNLSVTGHRPEKLGGYNPQHPLRMAVKAAMRSKILEIKPDYCLTGMALGVDQDFALLCIELGIPFIAAIPCSGQEKIWPKSSQDLYKEILDKAHAKEVICPGPYAAWKMKKRNEWLCHQASSLLAVWDGSEGGTAHCVKFAEARNIPIIRINPKELK